MKARAAGLTLLTASALGTPVSADPPGVVTFPAIDTRSFEELDIAGGDRYIALGVPRYAFSTTRPSFVVILDTQTGQQVARIDPPAPSDMDAFGIQLDIAEDTLFVTTYRDGRFGLPGSPGGSISTFTIPDGEFITSIASPVPSGFDYFGLPARVAGDVLVAGAPAEGFPNAKSGAVYTYALPDLTFIRRVGGINVEEDSVAFPMIANDQYIAWVRGTGSDSLPDDAVFVVHDIDTGELVTETRPTVDGMPVTTASFDLAADGRYAVLGDITDDRAGTNAGWVYVFDFQQMNFVGSFGPPPGSDGRRFGIRMAMRGDFAAVASPNFTSAIPAIEGRVDIVHVPSGRFVRSIGVPVDDTGDFGPLTEFGQAVTFVARGIAVTSRSSFAGARVDYFPVPELCPADVNLDGAVSPADFSSWLDAFNTNAPACDQNYDDLCTPADFNAWILNFNAGC